MQCYIKLMDASRLNTVCFCGGNINEFCLTTRLVYTMLESFAQQKCLIERY